MTRVDSSYLGIWNFGHLAVGETFSGKAKGSAERRLARERGSRVLLLA